MSIPSAVMPKLPATCANICTKARRYSLVASIATFSPENAEKAVSPPKKPVKRKRRMAGETDGSAVNQPTAIPMR